MKKVAAKRKVEVDARRVQIEFCRIGFQYYLSGRSAAMAGCNPVAGNLFHHAIEMLLKGALSMRSNEESREKLRHDLKRIWNRVKRAFSREELSEFDLAIRALDRFERIRYPETLLREGMSCSIGWGTTSAFSGKHNEYHCGIDDVDRLVVVLFKLCSLSPKTMSETRFQHGRMIVSHENQQSGELL